MKPSITPNDARRPLPLRYGENTQEQEGIGGYKVAVTRYWPRFQLYSFHISNNS